MLDAVKQYKARFVAFIYVLALQNICISFHEYCSVLMNFLFLGISRKEDETGCL